MTLLGLVEALDGPGLEMIDWKRVQLEISEFGFDPDAEIPQPTDEKAAILLIEQLQDRFHIGPTGLTRSDIREAYECEWDYASEEKRLGLPNIGGPAYQYIEKEILCSEFWRLGIMEYGRYQGREALLFEVAKLMEVCGVIAIKFE